MTDIINLHIPLREPSKEDQTLVGVPMEYLKDIFFSLALNFEAVGGCDHSVGICACEDERILNMVGEIILNRYGYATCMGICDRTFPVDSLKNDMCPTCWDMEQRALKEEEGEY